MVLEDSHDQFKGNLVLVKIGNGLLLVAEHLVKGYGKFGIRHDFELRRYGQSGRDIEAISGAVQWLEESDEAA